MPETPEWRAMSPEMRRRTQWFWDNDIRSLLDALRERFGDRLVGGGIEPFGDGFRTIENVQGLTEQEAVDTLAVLGERAELVELRSVRYSYADLRRVQQEMLDFVRDRPDAAAKSASGIGVGINAVTVWIRPDAPQLWEAIRERFGDAVRVQWGQCYHGWIPRPEGEGPPRIAG